MMNDPVYYNILHGYNVSLHRGIPITNTTFSVSRSSLSIYIY